MIELGLAIIITFWMLLSWYVLPPRGAFVAWMKARRRAENERHLDTEYERTMRDIEAVSGVSDMCRGQSRFIYIEPDFVDEDDARQSD